METNFKIRFELDIDPQRFIQVIHSNNENLNKRVEAGVMAALEEITKDGFLEEAIKTEVLKSITNSISSFAWQFEIKEKVSEVIKKRITAGIEKYSDKILSKTLEAIEKSNL